MLKKHLICITMFVGMFFAPVCAAVIQPPQAGSSMTPGQVVQPPGQQVVPPGQQVVVPEGQEVMPPAPAPTPAPDSGVYNQGQ